jgi:CheY-like chemotaxis protein
MVALTVRDTGTGVPPEAQARLFEPFFTTKGRDRGLGLGLAISADIINHHGGELALAATGATGSTFTVRLPRATATPPAHPAAPAAPRPDVRRPRVLVVDDERLLLDAYARVLDQEFELAVVDGGGAAIGILGADGDWDAVLCDVMMPDVDGVAVHDWVRDHRPALLPRLIFCTGGAFTPRTLAFTERKGVRLLHKPIGLRELRAVVKEVGRPILQA